MVHLYYRLQQVNALTKYQSLWADYEVTYNSIEESRGTRQKRQELDKMIKNSKCRYDAVVMTTNPNIL